jgi:hypothetical protein
LKLVQLNNNEFESFNFKNFVLLPITHIWKMYNIFSTSSEMSQLNEKNAKYLNSTCTMLKKLIERISDLDIYSYEGFSRDLKSESNLKPKNEFKTKKSFSSHPRNYQTKGLLKFPNDYIDNAGNKFYFL